MKRNRRLIMGSTLSMALTDKMNGRSKGREKLVKALQDYGAG
jgi:hypothetical protein